MFDGNAVQGYHRSPAGEECHAAKMTSARTRVLRYLSRLRRSPQIFNAEMSVAEDLVQQSRPQRFARMYGRHSAPAIFVTKKVMAASNTNHVETVLH